MPLQLCNLRVNMFTLTPGKTIHHWIGGIDDILAAGEFPYCFTIVKPNGNGTPQWADKDHKRYDIGRTFELEDFPGTYKVMYSGYNAPYVEEKTDDLSYLSTVLRPSRHAFVAPVGTTSTISRPWVIPAGPANGPWFDPKLPKRIDII
jgi:hypothetical protein